MMHFFAFFSHVYIIIISGIIPVPVQLTQQVASKNKRGRTVGYRTVVIDDTEVAMYGGK